MEQKPFKEYAGGILRNAMCKHCGFEMLEPLTCKTAKQYQNCSNYEKDKNKKEKNSKNKN